jgi:hypothetical protein
MTLITVDIPGVTTAEEFGAKVEEMVVNAIDNSEMMAILRTLAETNPYKQSADMYCFFCHTLKHEEPAEDVTNHRLICPWARAVKLTSMPINQV